MKEPTDIDLVLIGKTGNGKSATGNSILRRKAFKSRSCTSSVTLTVAYEVSEFDGRIIKVVDGPGVGDTRMNTEKAVNLVMETMEYAIAANPRGYHAFLLIVRFGGRFTEEDQDTIAFLKKIFGADFVQKYCILILTCGDNFEQDSEDNGYSFQEWCAQQEGVFQELLKECDNRAILINNTTKDESKRYIQIAKLLELVDNLSSRGNRYTDENFKKAQAARDRIIVESQIPVITEETTNETSLILMKLQNLEKQEDTDEKIKGLEHLQIRAENLFHSITARDRGTGALHDLRSTVKSVRKSVDEALKFFYRMNFEEKKIKTYIEEAQRQIEEQMRQQREEYEQRFKEDQRVLEEHRQYQKEQERQRRELEEKVRKEKEELEKKHKSELLEERRQQKKMLDELEEEYQNIKTENDKGIFETVVDTVTWPFKTITGWFF